MARFDSTDARILLALCDTPRATGVQLATRLGLARNTVQARLSRWETDEVLAPIDRCVSPADLRHPLRASIAVVVDQHKLEDVIARLRSVPEVIEALGISGSADLHVSVAATDSDDLYRIAGQVLAVPGVERTTVSVVMREAIRYRTQPLLERLVAAKDRRASSRPES
ncbi:Lrp/AsnC family transcriptional regulator [Nocardia farcinica]|uniref:Lrp/AsnC family transcriptional regulator n=1 Tax=Nocardia farcinica TaxID=37329 RepID=UPI001895818F|nr:Lrp/AsnC family transcriptional regulator [Nocardia farcinica]MBF6271556.1 Lrp/AsnC family transcriptional regulator [Nocardia farcinica]MCZ9330318.1 Lrp/AsnC family transcriptional regulator [Nocardia farcinica]